MPLAVDPARISGRWFRHGVAGAPALPDRSPPPDSRWQRGAVVDAVYLADSEETAWAEWYRLLAELEIPPNEQLPRELWTWHVDAVVADLSTEARLRRVGLSPPRPRRSSWPRFQRVGERLWRDGWPGLVAPSAARPRGRVLCLFRGTDGRVSGASPRGRPRRISEPPPPPTEMTT